MANGPLASNALIAQHSEAGVRLLDEPSRREAADGFVLVAESVIDGFSGLSVASGGRVFASHPAAAHIRFRFAGRCLDDATRTFIPVSNFCPLASSTVKQV